MDGVVSLSHGAGAYASHQFIEEIIMQELANPVLNQRSDQACLQLPHAQIAFSTDSFVVSPLFFPGGDIGSLAVHGTVNDLAMAGAKPLYLSLGLILEEGMPLSDVKRIIKSIAHAAKACGVNIVTGDTKVVEKGKGDGIYINTSGIGIIEHQQMLKQERIAPGDKIIINGSIGDHGLAVLHERLQLGFESKIFSDSQSLAAMAVSLCSQKFSLKYLRDPTRGGLAATLNEIACYCHLTISLDEKALVVTPDASALCEVLGLDPLTLANEGKMLIFCAPADAEAVVDHLKSFNEGKSAAIIGEVLKPEHQPRVEMMTSLGGRRLVSWNFAEPLPRIC